MSERGEVEVLLPLARKPRTPSERQALLHAAQEAATRLVLPAGGRVLGVSAVGRAVNPITMEQALRVRFAVMAPEHALPHTSSFQVSGLADRNRTDSA